MSGQAHAGGQALGGPCPLQGQASAPEPTSHEQLLHSWLPLPGVLPLLLEPSCSLLQLAPAWRLHVGLGSQGSAGRASLQHGIGSLVAPQGLQPTEKRILLPLVLLLEQERLHWLLPQGQQPRENPLLLLMVLLLQ